MYCCMYYVCIQFVSSGPRASWWRDMMSPRSKRSSRVSGGTTNNEDAFSLPYKRWQHSIVLLYFILTPQRMDGYLCISSKSTRTPKNITHLKGRLVVALRCVLCTEFSRRLAPAINLTVRALLVHAFGTGHPGDVARPTVLSLSLSHSHM